MHTTAAFFILSVLCALCALPPGYDEELFCPPSACLKAIHPPHRHGFSGQRSAFHECCDAATGQTAVPHSWGVRVNASVRAQLVDSGWHTVQCAQQQGPCNFRQQMALLLDRASRLIS